MIVAIIGNDGSGKTTMARELLKILGDLGFEVAYKHEYQYSVLKFLFSAIGSEKLEAERQRMIVVRRKSWKYYFWPFLVWFDGISSIAYLKLFKKRAILILDRYLYDHYMSFEYLGYLTGASRWLYRHSPKPDVNILLWVDPKIAYARKKNTHSYSITFYEKQTKSYSEFARDLGIGNIDTDKPLRKNLDEIFRLIPRKKLRTILRKGIQNRVLIKVIEKYGIDSAPLIFKTVQKMKKRKREIEEALPFIENLLQTNGIKTYAVMKTLYSDGWTGNDIDILVGNEEFSRIINSVRSSDSANVVLKHKFLEKGKRDIFYNNIPIDLHSYIGWRNVVFIAPDDILREDFLIKKENDVFFVNDKINCIITMATHVFEKGFITLDEYSFVKNHFDETLLRINFPYLCALLGGYVSWLRQTIRAKRHCPYPLFVPIGIITKSYLKLLLYSKNGERRFWKFRAAIRDISLMIFWRIRYTVKNKLPFELKADD